MIPQEVKKTKIPKKNVIEKVYFCPFSRPTVRTAEESA